MTAKKKKKHSSDTLTIIIVIILCLLIGFCGYKAVPVILDMHKVKKLSEATELRSDDADTWSYMDEFPAMKARNADFQGWLKFDSGLINLPFVYSETLDKYLRHDFDGNYSSSGTVFLDETQSLDGRNFTLYGHYVYADANLMFSPLEKLMDQENYDENKTFRLYLDDEIREYEIASVVRFDETNIELFPYCASSYGDETWNAFINYAERHKMYDTGVVLDPDARYTTLQTCIRNRLNDRLIIVGKQVRDYKNPNAK